MFNLQRFFALLLCLVALGGAAFADGTHDPIIDLEGGTGSNPYNGGSVSFTVNFDNSACPTPVPGEATVSCGTTTNFIRPGAPEQLGVFSNDTDTVITTIHISIETFTLPDGGGVMANVDEGTFSEFPSQEGGLFPGKIIMDPNGNGATFTGGDVCPVGADVCASGFDEFKVGYAEVLVPVGGSAVVEFDTNVSATPEPGSLALTASLLPGLWLMTKKKLVRR